MTSTWLPSSLDQENRLRAPGFSKGLALRNTANAVSAKKLSLLGPSKAKTGLSVSSKSGSTQRTFGDISNRLGQLSMSGQRAAPIKPKPIVVQQIKKKVVEPTPVVYEKETFPEIVETEDYSDLLPQSLILNDCDVKRLVESWRCLQRPAMPTSPAASPTRSCTDSYLQEEPYPIVSCAMQDSLVTSNQLQLVEESWPAYDDQW